MLKQMLNGSETMLNIREIFKNPKVTLLAKVHIKKSQVARQEQGISVVSGTYSF